MNLLNVLKKSIVESQIYVSLMGSLLASFFMIEQNTFRFPTFLLIFITYFCGYLYTKYQHTSFFYTILGINAVAGVICAMLIIQNNNTSRLFHWLVIVILGLLYNSKFLTHYVRKIPLVKIFYVGLVWALMNSWLTQPMPNIPIFFISFFWISALVLPFDIRDMYSDEVLTFPKLIGIKKTKFLAIFLLVISCMISITSLSSSFMWALVISALLTIPLLLLASPDKPDAYFSIGVETCCGLPFLILILLEYF